MATINPNFITYLKSRQRSENTIAVYTKHINEFLSYLNKPESEVTPFDVMGWMNSMSDKASATVAQCLSSVKSYFDFLFTYEIIDKDPTARIKPPKVNSKPKHFMDKEMARSMIESCSNIRDKAIVTTYVTTGMRVSELTGLTLAQYNKMKANGDNCVLIVGKGNKERYVYFNDETQKMIDAYLTARGNTDGPLFTTSHGNAIARNNLNVMLKSVAKKAGIPFWEDISNHALRSACASIYSEAGVPTAEIRDMLGHSSLAVTSRYIKTSAQNVRETVMNMSFC